MELIITSRTRSIPAPGEDEHGMIPSLPNFGRLIFNYWEPNDSAHYLQSRPGPNNDGLNLEHLSNYCGIRPGAPIKHFGPTTSLSMKYDQRRSYNDNVSLGRLPIGLRRLALYLLGRPTPTPSHRTKLYRRARGGLSTIPLSLPQEREHQSNSLE
eukprot:scaffold297259_cov45-Attheya_sp.AAC.3